MSETAARLGPAASVSDGHSREDGVLLACGLAWGAGLIHLQAAIDHIDEYWLYALLFALLASAQFLWGVAVYRFPRRGLLVAGAVVSLAVVAIWIASRTTGLPFGPEPGSPEPLGFLDAVATADEIALVAVAALQLGSLRMGKLARSSGSLVRVTGVLLIVLSSLALTGGVHAH